MESRKHRHDRGYRDRDDPRNSRREGDRSTDIVRRRAEQYDRSARLKDSIDKIDNSLETLDINFSRAKKHLDFLIDKKEKFKEEATKMMEIKEQLRECLGVKSDKLLTYTTEDISRAYGVYNEYLANKETYSAYRRSCYNNLGSVNNASAAVRADYHDIIDNPEHLHLLEIKTYLERKFSTFRAGINKFQENDIQGLVDSNPLNKEDRSNIEAWIRFIRS